MYSDVQGVPEKRRNKKTKTLIKKTVLKALKIVQIGKITIFLFMP